MGRENRFVRELGQHDLERFSRLNSHELSDWRTLHESGRGILLNLADFGLTENIAFGAKERIEFSFTLLTTTDPAPEAVSGMTTEDVIDNMTRRFHAVLIRQNRVLRGDIQKLQFSYANEDVRL